MQTYTPPQLHGQTGLVAKLHLRLLHHERRTTNEEAQVHTTNEVTVAIESN
jgi:hypothetical protein